MKILFVVRNIQYAGASKMVAFVMNGLAEKGYNVSVLTYNNYSVGQSLHDTIHFYQGKPQSGLKEYCYAVKRIKEVIIDFNPNVIVAFRDNASALAVIATLFKKIPVIVCERSDPYMEVNLSLRIARFFFRYAGGGVFQTKEAQRYFEKSIKNYSIIPNPVLPIKKQCKGMFEERENIILNVARLEIVQKRQDVLLEAFKFVIDKYPQMKLGLCGDGIDKDKLLKQAEKLSILNNVYFYGVVKDIPDKLYNSKMFVLSSDYEGISNALIEAMSMGLPCISTDTSPGGARVLIKNGENGFIVPRNNPKALAEKIIFYLEHPQVANKHGENAKNIVNEFSPKHILDMWEKFIIGCANKN